MGKPSSSKESPAAADVIARFGGARNLMRALEYVGLAEDPSCIYRWTYPYPRGTGGRIPRKAWAHVQIAAKRARVNLDGVRMIPRKVPGPKVRKKD